MTLSLFSFDDEISAEPRKDDLVPGAFVLRGFALPDEAAHLEAVRQVTARAPLRHMVTPGGFRKRMGIGEINADRLDCRNCNRFDAAKRFVAGLL